MNPHAAGTTIRTSGAVVILRGLGEVSIVERLADTLVGLGFMSLEVTLNSPSALATIAHLRRRLGDRAMIGAGTVRTAQDVQLAVDAGAQFLVAPCFDPASVEAARATDRLFIPGVLTPSEAQHAHIAGCSLLKLFPSDLFGPAYLQALRAPLDDLDFIPTGGVEAANAAAYIRAGAAALGIGSALTRYADNIDELESAAQRLREVIDTARESLRAGPT